MNNSSLGVDATASVGGECSSSALKDISPPAGWVQSSERPFITLFPDSMYLLPCSDCDQSITLSASKAGQEVECLHCHTMVAVPKLGELRNLPLVEGTESATKSATSSGGPSAGNSIAFIVCALVATGCLLVASYSGIRWYLIDRPTNSDTHIAELKAAYQKAPAASLILEYESIEKLGIEGAGPYQYKVIANTKADWGFNALVAAAIGAASVAGAGLAASRR